MIKVKKIISLKLLLFENLELIYFSLVLVFILNCGAGQVRNTASSDEVSDVVNTAKLVGTPFEELTMGDGLDPNMFLCSQYQTNTISDFPIKIFTAFFTGIEEDVIQEGIAIANEAIGFTAYELTNTWSDDVRVIYKVDIEDTWLGKTYTNDVEFDDLSFARRQVVDWSIEITYTDKWVIAHELGHSVGIRSHALIDYENNTLLDLEENSLMEAIISTSSPTLNDYNYMMNKQGQIMLDHLGEKKELDRDSCD